MVLRLNRKNFLADYVPRAYSLLGKTNLPPDQRRAALDLVFNLVPTEEEWKALEAVEGVTENYLKKLTLAESDRPTATPYVCTKDGIWFEVTAGLPFEGEERTYHVPLWFSYDHPRIAGQSKYGRFRADTQIKVQDGAVVDGTSLDELQLDLYNKAITHFLVDESDTQKVSFVQ